MKGAILEKGEKYYTYLSRVFSSIHNVQKQYNWLITNCDCHPTIPEYDELLSTEYCFLTGDELTEMVEQDDFQWIWAVLSGFERNINLNEILKYELPYADGNSGFWINPISLQHPLAEIEIVPCDSSLTLILSKNDEHVLNFMKTFPLSEDLTEYNKKIK